MLHFNTQLYGWLSLQNFVSKRSERKKISRLKIFYLQIPRVVFTGADLWNNAKLPVTGDCQSFVINFPPADVSWMSYFFPSEPGQPRVGTRDRVNLSRFSCRCAQVQYKFLNCACASFGNRCMWSANVVNTMIMIVSFFTGTLTAFKNIFTPC